MSIEITNRVWRQHLPPTPKLLLLALADMAGHDGACRPSVDILAERVGVTRMTIFVSLKALQNARLLEITRRPGHHSIYRILISTVAA